MFFNWLRKLKNSNDSASQSKYQHPHWLKKQLPVEKLSEKVPNGSHVFIGSGSATAHQSLSAIVHSKTNIVDINILQFIPGGNSPHLDKQTSQFRTTSFFAYSGIADKVQQGLVDYIPTSTAKLHRLLKDKHIPIDVAIVKLTPPNEEGWCSLGIGVDISTDAVSSAKIVIAEICPSMPWTHGDTLIHVDDIDWWSLNEQPIPTAKELFPQIKFPPIKKEVLDKLAENVLFEIPDGATIKFDVSVFTDNLVPYLKQKKNLGLYTDILNDQLFELIKTGAITNSEKNISQGKTIVSHAFGSKELYDYVNNNPQVEFYSSYQVNRLDKIARQDNLIYLMAGLKVDLTGQVAVDSLGSRLYGGVESTDDSIRGAGYSSKGKPIVVLPSKTPKGNSNIILALPEGTGVVITRLDVHYVITEYGTAFLFGKSIRERCLALIDIAHPDFRIQLMRQAKNCGFIHGSQLGHSFKSSYPKQFEKIHQTTANRSVFVRPIKAIDEDKLRDFFHDLSDQNVYMRYFSQIKSLPQKILKQYTDIDYSVDMALVALSPPSTAQNEIIGIAQWIVTEQNSTPEIAFQISDDWQGEGLGKFFFLELISIAKIYGYPQLKAEVLLSNTFMNALLEKSDIRYQRKKSNGVYSYTFYID